MTSHSLWTRTLVSTPVMVMLLLPGPPVSARQEGERLTDAVVKRIIEDVDESRDRFEDQLDGKVKGSIIRGPNGEVSVQSYLEDLQRNVKSLKDRFSKQYAASKEAETVLKQGTEIDTALKALPREIKGRSEWDTLSLNLDRLASAYRTSFPLPDGAVVRRINDAEASSTAEAVAKSAEALKKQIDQEKGLPDAARKSAKDAVEAFSKQAQTVKSRVSDSLPATAEMRTLMSLFAPVEKFVGESQLLPSTRAAFGSLKGPLDMLQQAYGFKPPAK